MRLVGRIAGLCLLLLTSACALERDFVELRYGNARFATPVAGAAGVGMTVEARDARTSRQDRVSNKVNGYGMEMAPIIATNDVVAEVRQALDAEFQRAGFRTGGTDARVEVEILRFYNQFRTGFWAGSAEAEIQVMLRLRDATGREAYSRVYTVQSVLPAVQLANGSNAVIALQGAMEKLVEAILGDAAFISALTSTADRRDQPRRRIPAGRTTGA